MKQFDPQKRSRSFGSPYSFEFPFPLDQSISKDHHDASYSQEDSSAFLLTQQELQGKLDGSQKKQSPLSLGPFEMVRPKPTSSAASRRNVHKMTKSNLSMHEKSRAITPTRLQRGPEYRGPSPYIEYDCSLVIGKSRPKSSYSEKSRGIRHFEYIHTNPISRQNTELFQIKRAISKNMFELTGSKASLHPYKEKEVKEKKETKPKPPKIIIKQEKSIRIKQRTNDSQVYTGTATFDSRRGSSLGTIPEHFSTVPQNSNRTEKSEPTSSLRNLSSRKVAIPMEKEVNKESDNLSEIRVDTDFVRRYSNLGTLLKENSPVNTRPSTVRNNDLKESEDEDLNELRQMHKDNFMRIVYKGIGKTNIKLDENFMKKCEENRKTFYKRIRTAKHPRKFKEKEIG